MERKRRSISRTPAHLYHGTPAKNFASIAQTGLLPYSRGEKGVRPYISFSVNPKTTPLLGGNRDSDIIFKVVTRHHDYFQGGAGYKEWRTNASIQPEHLMYVTRKELRQTPIPWKRLEQISFLP